MGESGVPVFLSPDSPEPWIAMKTLVLGLGNPILTDDGVGIHVVRAAASRRSPSNSVAFAEASVGGLRLLDLLAGYERVIMVDAIQTRGRQPGDIYRIGPCDLQASLHSGSTHDLSLPGALDLGRRLGMKLPGDKDLMILAVEVEDVLTFGETCTPAVTRAIPHAVEIMLAELKE
jgi:hydrogenase maturation protease